MRDPNLGGSEKFDWGTVKLVPALHTSTTPKGTVSPPAGLLIHFEDTVVYHLGDTACSPTCSWSASARRSTSR